MSATSESTMKFIGSSAISDEEFAELSTEPIASDLQVSSIILDKVNCI